jgi:hypothetical protein
MSTLLAQSPSLLSGMDSDDEYVFLGFCPSPSDSECDDDVTFLGYSCTPVESQDDITLLSYSPASPAPVDFECDDGLSDISSEDETDFD